MICWEHLQLSQCYEGGFHYLKVIPFERTCDSVDHSITSVSSYLLFFVVFQAMLVAF